MWVNLSIWSNNYTGDSRINSQQEQCLLVFLKIEMAWNTNLI